MSKVERLIKDQGYTELDEVVMTNFDHSIEPWAEEKLRKESVVGVHCAWNFCGYVWWGDDARFHEEVWVYGSPVDVVSADSLEDLMLQVNAEYGSD